MATIRRRNGKYQVQVRINGYTRSKTFPSHDLARKWANKQETIAFTEPEDRPRYVPANFAEILDKYWLYAEKHHKGATNEKIVIRALQREVWVKKPIDELNKVDIVQYRDQRLLNVKPSTFKRQLNLLRSAAHKAAVEWNWKVDQEIFRDLRLPKQDEKHIRRITPDIEYGLLVAAEKSKNPLMRPIIEIALDTGLRRGELLQLRADYVDLAEQIVVATNTKNGHCRPVPLTKRAVANFRGLLEHGTTKLLPMTPNAVRLAFERIRSRSGHPWVRFHDLRHEAISRWFELGMTIPEIMQLSGHRDSNVLMRYAHAYNQRVKLLMSK
ncbi:MAG: site-specific integrase [Proteobacteria bacterium]|nr:site-specific integrase [Pseudomonadota bacterium]